MASDEISFLPLGAILQSLHVGGINIVQGFPSQEHYEAHNSPHFGATIGRVANRISGATINSLNGGKSYKLQANDGPNSLHGGEKGWGKRVWDGPKPVGTRDEAAPGFGKFKQGGEGVRFSLHSPDGDEGFPGTVDASVVYTAGKDDKGATLLGMEYEATLVDGADETVINMTNHSYFNLSGGPSIEGTQVELATNQYLPLDDDGIPTTTKPTAYPKFEGKKPFTLGASEPDVDDCFVLDDSTASSVPLDTRSQPLTRLVAAHHPATGIHLEVYSTEPAFQFYTGKYIDVPALSGAPARSARAGFCVEPSRYVNALNVAEWKDQTLLKKGETYGARIVYKAWKE
ncbi:aldose 1-epimerase [Diaporthe helianthi]|uniref:Aldose 1-epimerase n=1 Tax=Diaporthe helianthi TaxID=158607 RepID=A0A2P5I3D8_DIAHE|nr:aldose 1-epimerase [Diaporthe helianthi]